MGLKTRMIAFSKRGRDWLEFVDLSGGLALEEVERVKAEVARNTCESVPRYTTCASNGHAQAHYYTRERES